MTSLDALQFDNTFLRELPADPEERNFRRQVREACFSRVLPEEVKSPELVAYSPEVAELLGLPEDAHKDPEFAQVFSGNHLVEGMEPFATCYGGHQFGNWAGQLGDGRAINLGEVVGKNGEHFEIQLKGSGPTPYSRRGDGRAVLRSSIREFLCSEAMHHLGVASTRALSLVTTGESIVRDMFYDGNPRPEPGAVVCRVAPSFLRFGNFQIFAAHRDEETLKTLTDYAITHHFPHLGEPGTEKTYLRFFEDICCRTADMIVDWMRVGFVHGVMNTDNMSILGLTIDYGPYGWLEDYDPGWTPNTTDARNRRYAFGQQPQVALWNLAQLGTALSSLIGGLEPMKDTLTIYTDRFNTGWQTMMANKLGLSTYDEAKDDDLVDELLKTLMLTETDMTIFYRKLADIPAHQPDFDIDNATDEELIEPLLDAYYLPEELQEKTPQIATWLRNYAARLKDDDQSAADRRALMNRTNPKYVLRNYMAQLAIDESEKGDHSLVNELLDLLRNPYDEQPEREEFASRRPEWARNRPGCSMLSCSS